MLALTAQLPALGLPTTINSEADLQRLVPAIREAINKLRLWEYYVFDVESSVKAVAAALEQGQVTAWSGETIPAGLSAEQLAWLVLANKDIVENYQTYGQRYGTRVDPSVAAGFIQAAGAQLSVPELAAKWGKVLDVLNVDLYHEVEEDVSAAIEAIEGRLKFTRLEGNGPKLGEINEK
jgi:glycogen debranching enzyme